MLFSYFDISFFKTSFTKVGWGMILVLLCNWIWKEEMKWKEYPFQKKNRMFFYRATYRYIMSVKMKMKMLLRSYSMFFYRSTKLTFLVRNPQALIVINIYRTVYIPKRSYGKLKKVNTLKPDKIYVHFGTTKEQTTGM